MGMFRILEKWKSLRDHKEEVSSVVAVAELDKAV